MLSRNINIRFLIIIIVISIVDIMMKWVKANVVTLITVW